MRLIWVKFNGSSKYRLYLELGVYNDKLCCIDQSMLTDDEVFYIRANYGSLSRMKDIREMIYVLKNMESIRRKFNKIYKTISVNSVNVESSYSIGDINAD